MRIGKKIVRFSKALPLLVAILSCLALYSCEEKSEDSLNREILIYTVWAGSYFPGDQPGDLNNSSTQFLYDFDFEGILSIYAGGDYESEPIESLRYIYTPSDNEIVIEHHGTFKILELSVDYLRLSGEKGELALYDHINLPPE